MVPINGRQLSPDQFQMFACDCGCTCFDLIPRVFLLRNKLARKDPLIEQPAKGYKCSKCGKEPDLRPKALENL